VKYETVKGGLRVEKLRTGWAVLHAWSDLPAVQLLRQRRFAEEARGELLATGVDFTRAARLVQADRKSWQDVYYRWHNRTHVLGDKLEDLDPVTFEYYPDSTRYGQFIPSAAQAGEMRQLAMTFRLRGRIPVSEVALEVSGRYVDEFARMGLIVRDDTELIWAGAKA
jgi:hypothetical protein